MSDGATVHPKSRGAARRAQRRGPTMEDVATVAGVSRGTVSRVLNGAVHVSPESLAAVQAAMRETGYVVNQSARSLVTRRSGAVAFVLSEPQDRLFEDPVWRGRALAAIVAAVPSGRWRVALPAVLGVASHAEVHAAAEEAIGARAFEVASLPPSVPGMRLFDALRHRIEHGTRSRSRARRSAPPTPAARAWPRCRPASAHRA